MWREYVAPGSSTTDNSPMPTRNCLLSFVVLNHVRERCRGIRLRPRLRIVAWSVNRDCNLAEFGSPSSIQMIEHGDCVALSSCAVIARRHNGNVHRAAAKIIVSKSRAARGSVCNVLLSDGFCQVFVFRTATVSNHAW